MVSPPCLLIIVTCVSVAFWGRRRAMGTFQTTVSYSINHWSKEEIVRPKKTNANRKNHKGFFFSLQVPCVIRKNFSGLQSPECVQSLISLWCILQPLTPSPSPPLLWGRKPALPAVRKEKGAHYDQRLLKCNTMEMRNHLTLISAIGLLWRFPKQDN